MIERALLTGLLCLAVGALFVLACVVVAHVAAWWWTRSLHR